MNSLQIERVLKSYYATKRNFLGCYAADQLKSIIKNTNFPYSLIVNTDISSKPGEHWVAMFITNSTTIEYFDTFAEIPNELITDFLSRFPKVIENKKILQSPFSDACGHFCIYFIIKRSLGYSFNSIISVLYKINNADKFVKNFVNMLLT